MMLVDDPESANVGADGTNLGGNVDDPFVFVDQSMVTSSFGRQIEVGTEINPNRTKRTH
jgi:hypothetical protein